MEIYVKICKSPWICPTACNYRGISQQISGLCICTDSLSHGGANKNDWGMIEAYLGHVWVCMQCLGHFEACLGHVWALFGSYLGNLLGTFGVCLRHVWEIQSLI